MRVLGVDFGGTRIGIAVGESEHKITTARPLLQASGKLKSDAQAIAELARTEQADSIVVGIPLDEGEETPMSRVCRQLAERLREEGLVVATIDESMTSVEAEKYLQSGTLKASQRRKLRDGEAARLILERFFDEQDNAQA